MALRRVAGAITALLMLHLSLVASDVACATHMPGHDAGMGVAHRAAPSSAHHGSMNAEMASHAGHERGHHDRPCDTPAQPNCCQALASCGSIFTAGDVAANAPLLQRNIFARSAVAVPASVLVAPDTPPPRA